MSFNVEDSALEHNIRLKELELLRIVEESHNLVAWNTIQPFPYYNDPVCDLHLKMSPVSPIVHHTSLLHNQIKQLPLNYWNGINTISYSKMIQNTVSQFSVELQLKLGHNIYGNLNNKSNIDNPSPECSIFPVYSNKPMQQCLKNTKNNKKKNNLPMKSVSQNMIDYSKVVVNLKEIQVTLPNSKAIDSNMIVAKFRRLYIYLSSLCKERILLESIIFAKECKSHGKYIFPQNLNIAGHIEYALKTLSAELTYVETIILNIQQRCEDSKFINLWREQANNLLAGMNVLSILNGGNMVRDTKDTTPRVNDVLSDLITSVRYVGIIYTIAAQKLLMKETTPYGQRRRIFIGR